MRILGTICARGGSKGVKNKNIKLLEGKPLLSYSINALKAWRKANRIICSTDDKKIMEIAKNYGAEIPFRRPAHLATDSANKLDVLKHMVKYCEEEEGKQYDIIVDLDPTSPLRNIEDIENAYHKFRNSDADVLYSVYKSHKNPYFNMVELDAEKYAHLVKKPNMNITSRQKSPTVFSLNASIYVYKRDFLLNTEYLYFGKNIIYEMKDYCIDIDREIDFNFIEFILREGIFKFDY